MHAGIKPALTTGIAIVGAGAIAVAPAFAPTPPEVYVPAPSAVSGNVELAAFQDPFTTWLDVFTTSFVNAGTIADEWLADPFPALRQFLQNQIGYGEITVEAVQGAADALVTQLTTALPEQLRTALMQLADGEPAEAATTFSNAIVGTVLVVGINLFPTLAIPTDITGNLDNVVSAVTNPFGLPFQLLNATLGPPTGVIAALGDSAQQFVDALNADDLPTALSAVINAPADAVGAFLNGYTASTGGVYTGLLTPGGGLVEILTVTLPQTIADALGAGASSAAPAAAVETAEEPDAQASASESQDPGSVPTGVLATGNPQPQTVVVSNKLAEDDEEVADEDDTAAEDGNAEETDSVDSVETSEDASEDGDSTSGDEIVETEDEAVDAEDDDVVELDDESQSDTGTGTGTGTDADNDTDTDTDTDTSDAAGNDDGGDGSGASGQPSNGAKDKANGSDADSGDGDSDGGDE